MNKSAWVKTGMSTAGKLAVSKDGTLHPQAEGALVRVLSVQRPVVLAYIRSVRRRHPAASPAEISRIIESHYVNLVTAGGAGVGLAAAVPGVGTATAVGVSAVETLGFLEGAALFAQANAELHAMPVEDPERANALVLGLMLGNSGRDMVKQFAGHVEGGAPVTANWTKMVTSTLPLQFVDEMTRKMGKMLMRKFALKFGGTFFGKLVPFGVGAVVGGVVNRKMAKTMAENARVAFGDTPHYFEPELEITVSDAKKDADLLGGLRNIMRARKKKADEADDNPIPAWDPTVDEEFGEVVQFERPSPGKVPGAATGTETGDASASDMPRTYGPGAAKSTKKKRKFPDVRL